MIIGIWKEEMVFKLPDESVREQALALEGAHLFDPSRAKDGPSRSGSRCRPLT